MCRYKNKLPSLIDKDSQTLMNGDSWSTPQLSSFPHPIILRLQSNCKVVVVGGGKRNSTHRILWTLLCGKLWFSHLLCPCTNIFGIQWFTMYSLDHPIDYSNPLPHPNSALFLPYLTFFVHIRFLDGQLGK